MTNNLTSKRVLVRGQNRGNIQGFQVTSRRLGGVFGTQIFVRHLSTAFAIKNVLKAEPIDHAKIDALIHEDAAR